MLLWICQGPLSKYAFFQKCHGIHIGFNRPPMAFFSSKNVFLDVTSSLAPMGTKSCLNVVCTFRLQKIMPGSPMYCLSPNYRETPELLRSTSCLLNIYTKNHTIMINERQWIMKMSRSVTQGHRENWGKSMCTSFGEECNRCMWF